MVLPWNMPNTHNYLEWTYKLKNLSYDNQSEYLCFYDFYEGLRGGEG